MSSGYSEWNNEDIVTQEGSHLPEEMGEMNEEEYGDDYYANEDEFDDEYQD
jgi:hypothetical protein